MHELGGMFKFLSFFHEFLPLPLVQAFEAPYIGASFFLFLKKHFAGL